MSQTQLSLVLNNQYVDLASERVGGQALSCSDDFFAPMDNLLKSGRGIFIEDKYTERGKWMDGWESRRSYGRDNGREYDWCVIKLGIRGVIAGIDVDTNHFRGNSPAQISVEACRCQIPDEHTQWTTIVDKQDVSAHSQNVFKVETDDVFTHVRLNMFPDGGVARLRVFGRADVDWSACSSEELVDLGSIRNGGRSLLVSDMFFSDKNNLLMPGRGVNMGDGWETKRRRDPGPDWNIIRLGREGCIQKIILDTCHFKGNFPDRFSLEGCSDTSENVLADKVDWYPIITQQPLKADYEHGFSDEIDNRHRVFNHVRLSIYPDGGVSRLRIMARFPGEQ